MTPQVEDDLPHDIYMSLTTGYSRYDVVKLFTSRGWASRQCAWTEYEITSDFAELVIASENPILLSGSVSRDSNAVPSIAKILNDARIEFEFEVYDENHRMIASRSADGRST